MATVAQILANAPQQQGAVAQPFVWGQGGQMIDPGRLAEERARSDAMMQSNYSPVGSVWEGLGRVTDNWLGAFDSRRLDRQSQDLASQREAQIGGLLGEGNADLVPALSGADPVAQALAQAIYGQRTAVNQPDPTPLQRNYQWLQSMGRTEEAENLLGKETNPIRWTPYVDPATGQLSFMPIGLDGPILGGGDQAISPSSGAALPSPGGVPNGSPLSQPPARPQGMSDDALKQQALEAVRQGANIDEVFGRLRAWGVQP